MTGIWIGIGAALLLLLLGYNTLVCRRNAVENAFSSVEILMMRLEQ